MAQALVLDDWTGEDTSIAEIERVLASLREAAAADGPDLRTSVATHLAWVPAEWLDAARATLAGLAERHPSRTVLLTPEPGAPDGLDAAVSLRCFPLAGMTRTVCTEVVELRLRGGRAAAPASVVLPLLISDLPVFCRWRGRPPFDEAPFRRLVGVVDRLVVDSSEWPDVPVAYGEVAGVLGDTAVSDIAFGRSLAWRVRLAGLWPGIASLSALEVVGPRADALLLAGWLRSRLGTEVELRWKDGPSLARVAVDGEDVAPPDDPPPTSSDLLSAELDVFGRDPTYEGALLAAK
ncbi:MAG: glucose-6-phosphate dehydrogenase assembly protein OpcA [Actinobacteria bacterium]|nr:glucose-6-phosphate dehydrogenase assembly protein OpcA [Actinomycetota bacterium]